MTDNGGADRTVGIGKVAGDVRTVVSGTQGDVHAGDVIYNYSAPIRAPRGPSTFDREYERKLNKVFVSFGTWSKAVARLAEHHDVFLVGAPASGRRAAACRLLAEYQASSSNDILCITLVEDDPDADKLLDPDEVGDGARLLVDLADADARTFDRAQDELQRFSTTIREHGGHLVVILPDQQNLSLRPAFVDRVVNVSRPDGRQVWERHLAWYNVVAAGVLPREIDELLTTSGPGRIDWVCSLVSQARDAEPTLGFAGWIDAALKAARVGQPEIAELLKENIDSPQRALMLAAAVFDGASVDVVSDAEHRLLDALRHRPEIVVPPFERPDLGSRLDSIKFRISDDDRVVEKSFHHAAAVRAYLWTTFPALHTCFRTWMIACGQLLKRPGVDLDEVVGRFANESIRTGRPADVTFAVEAWCADRSVPVAVPRAALVRSLRDPRSSWFLRQRCYDWAIAPTTSAALALLVIAACRDVMAEVQQRPAVVRLHWFARRTDPVVAEEARAALAQLTRSSQTLTAFLLDRITKQEDRGHAQADLLVFHAVATAPAANRTILDEATTVSRLWARTFAELPAADVGRTVGTWLTAAAAASGRDRAMRLRVLVTAARTRFAWSADLYDATENWLRAGPGDPARRDVHHALVADLTDPTSAPSSAKQREPR